MSVGRRLGWLLALGLCACGQDEQALTQLVLVADTDIVEVERIRFTVSGAGRTDSLVAEAAHPPGSGPSYVALLRDEGALSPLVVTASGLARDGSVRLARSHQVSFVVGQTRTVLLHLFASCLDAAAACDPAAQTCAEAGCVSHVLAEAELEPWTGSAPALAADAGPAVGDGGVANDAGVPSLSTCGDAGMVDTQSDVRHCGDCETACVQNIPANFHAVSLCAQGSCKYACIDGWDNCDGKDDNGCEADLSRPDRCGSCSNKCEKGHMCMGGVCSGP